MQLGISYYPEYYPQDQWDRHFEALVEGGFKRVRFGESSWATFQPARHEFRWEVMDDAIEKAASFGVEVVLGTPTYVPPLWLVKEHPEILPVGVDGRRTVFGARQHRCFNTPAYVDAANAISHAMAERYGKHPNVVAWQIDNELGGEQKRCYCDNCRRTFQEFLRARYGNIGDLNRRWNTVFWGQQYDSFEDVNVPIRFNADLEMRHHPALELDFQRFSSDSIVRFCEGQYDIIRSCTSQPITHNTDSFFWGDNVDVWKLFQRLDVAGMDLYSDRPFEIAFYSDLTRSVSKADTFWMMEYGTRSPGLEDEMEVTARRGCEWLIFFKLLPFPWGQEIDRKALLTLTGNPEPNYHVVRKWAGQNSTKRASPRQPSRVGLFYDFDSSWAYFVDQWRPGIPVPDRQIYPRYLIDVVYQALFELGLSVDLLFEPERLHEYQTIVVARHLLYDPLLEDVLLGYVANEGTLLATTDLFRRSDDNAWLEIVPNIYREAFGWDGADFPDDTVSPCAFPTITHQIGKGTARLIHKEADRTVWQSALSAELPETSPRTVPEKSMIYERVYDQRAATPPILQPSDA
jgi:beta-galactosidase